MVIMGLSPVLYLLHFICISMYPDVCDKMPKTVHPLGIEVDFVLAEVKLGLTQFVEHLGQVSLMLFDGQRVYEYVIQVYLDELCNVIAEDRCHQPLKCRWGITVPLLHYLTHECAKYSGEGCLVDVFRHYAFLFIRL